MKNLLKLSLLFSFVFSGTLHSSADEESLADAFKDALKEKAEEILEEKRGEYGLSDEETVENVAFVFSGGGSPEKEVFTSLHTPSSGGGTNHGVATGPILFPTTVPLILTTPVVTPGPLKEKECFSYVQGKFAWDPAGKQKTWNPRNIQRLCKGTKSQYSPGNCFQYAMRKGSQWGKKASDPMDWNRAVNLCQGTSKAKETTKCFKESMVRLGKVDLAISQCSKKW